MKAVRFHEYGSKEVLRYEDAPDPAPEPGEVVIRVRSCGVNRLDLDLRNGVSRIPLDLPFISGIEIAGDIVALGHGVKDFKIGDRVSPSFYYACGHCGKCGKKRDNLCDNRRMFGVTRPGGYAELVAAPAKSLIKFGEGFSYDQAAATQVAFGTAFHMLISRAKITEGETVLIQAAGSGVGSAAVQIAHSTGLRIITTASSDEKLQQAKAYGADKTFNYCNQDFVDGVMDYTGGRGVDVVFEHVGGEVFTKSLACLAVGGRLVTCGAHAGEVTQIDIIELFRKEATVLGSYTSSISELNQVMALAEVGKLKPIIYRALPLRDAAQGQEILARREQFGKVILNP